VTPVVHVVHSSCSRDWTTAAAVAEYKYVWRSICTKSLSDFVQLCSSKVKWKN